LDNTTQDVRIDINNVPEIVPTINDNFSVLIKDTTGIGTHIGDISFDEGDTDVIDFTLNDSSFSIDKDGKVTTNADLDYSTKSSYTLEMFATNLKGDSIKKSFTVNLYCDKIGYLVDSGVEGVYFEIDGVKTGTTGTGGRFDYDTRDTSITFTMGDLTLVESYQLANMNADGLMLPSDMVGVNRENTSDEGLIKIIRVLQSLDYDDDPSNGIYIDDNTKGYLDTVAILIDENISSLTTMVEKTGKKLKGQRKSREHYIQKLKDLGIEPELMKFISTWETAFDGDYIEIEVDKWKYDYNYTIEWGDGNINRDVKDKARHAYSKKGTYKIKISEKFPYIDGGSKIREVTQWGDIAWESFDESFDFCDNLDVISTDTPDLRKVTSTRQMFYFAMRLTGNSYFNDWDTSHIKDMTEMFYIASDFNAPIGKWDTSSVTNMKFMLGYAEKFNQQIGSWDVSNVTNMSRMFRNAVIFNQELNKWDVSNVTNIDGMFYDAGKFNKPLNKWKTGNVNTMKNVFNGADDFNQELRDWDTRKVTNMESMFEDASSFRNHDLRGWDVTNVSQHQDFMKDAGGGNTEPNFP
jgi:surface protein